MDSYLYCNIHYERALSDRSMSYVTNPGGRDLVWGGGFVKYGEKVELS